MAKAPQDTEAQTAPPERRRHRRLPVELQVRVHFVGRTMPVTAGLADVSTDGCYLRGLTAPQAAKLAVGFRMGRDRVCLAAGQVVRVDQDGFAVRFDRRNAAFENFIAQITDYASFEAA
jgi:hypothetical protein